MSRLRGADARSLASCLVSLLLLAACATPSLVPPERAYSGRFSASTALGDQRDTVSGRFALEVRGDRQTLDLLSPLGTTVARIEIEPGSARATGAQMREVRGQSGDELTEQLLGWRLPVSGLTDWLEGRPAPARPARVERDGGRVTLIEQDGWTIRLPEYFESRTEVRPRRLVLERPEAMNSPAVILRLIVDEPST